MEREGIRLRKICADDHEITALAEINREAFPKEERAPLDGLLQTVAEIVGIFRGGMPCGFFALRSYRKIRYLAFFAVRQDLRDQGIGREALALLKESCAGHVLVTECEAPYPEAESGDIRHRRKRFYLRSGFRETGWFSRYDGTEFEILCTGPFDHAEYAQFTRYLSGLLEDPIPEPYQRSGENIAEN